MKSFFICTEVLVLFFSFAGAAAAQAMDGCMKAYNEEVTAIEREAKEKQNVGSTAAKQRAARSAETRLEAAARQAKKCQEDAKAPADGAKAAAKAAAAKPAGAEDCKARTSARAADIERRFGSTTLDPAQQNLRREEEIRLQAELNECNRAR
jgi:hypothetical protein